MGKHTEAYRLLITDHVPGRQGIASDFTGWAEDPEAAITAYRQAVAGQVDGTTVDLVRVETTSLMSTGVAAKRETMHRYADQRPDAVAVEQALGTNSAPVHVGRLAGLLDITVGEIYDRARDLEGAKPRPVSVVLLNRRDGLLSGEAVDRIVRDVRKAQGGREVKLTAPMGGGPAGRPPQRPGGPGRYRNGRGPDRPGAVRGRHQAPADPGRQGRRGHGPGGRSGRLEQDADVHRLTRHWVPLQDSWSGALARPPSN